MDFSHDFAIAFDLDDTLYDEKSYVAACVENVARSLAPVYGVDCATLQRQMLDGPNPYDGLRDGGLCPGTDIETFLSIYRSTSPDTLPLRPDALRLLEALAARRPEVERFIITDGRLHGQQAKINALQLGRFFDPRHIIISDAIGFDKYTPMPFITAMTRANRYKSWCYVGDNVAKDFHWPRRLGWHAIMVADRGLNTHAQPPLDSIDPDFRPDQTIDSFDQITSLICP